MVSKNFKKNQDAEQSEDAKQLESKLFGFRAVYVFDRLSRVLRPSLCAPDVIRVRHLRKSPQ
jgi:hypothetical protein